MATLCKQLAAARRSGPNLLAVLRVLAEDNSWPKSVRRQILHPIAKAAVDHLLCDIPVEQLPFPPSAVALLVAAEREGVLANTLDALSDDFFGQDATRRAVLAAIFWPFTALLVLGLMLLVAGVYLLPAFRKVYSDAGVSMPLPTRALGSLIGWTLGLWWFWIPVIFIVVVISLTQRWPRRVQTACAAACFVVPFVRRYLTDRYMVRVARWLTVVVAGSTLRAEIFRYLQQTQLVPKLQGATQRAEQTLNTGASYSDAMAASSLPRRLGLFLKIGEMNNDAGAALQLFLNVAIADERESLSRFERGVLLLSYLIVGMLVACYVSGVYGSISYFARAL